MRDGNRSPVKIAIISGSCCIPGMASFDEQATRITHQAMAETGVEASVTIVPATSALLGGVSKKIMGELMAMFNQGGRVGLPAVLIDGDVLSYAVPRLEDLKAKLNFFAEK